MAWGLLLFPLPPLPGAGERERAAAATRSWSLSSGITHLPPPRAPTQALVKENARLRKRNTQLERQINARSAAAIEAEDRQAAEELEGS